MSISPGQDHTALKLGPNLKLIPAPKWPDFYQPDIMGDRARMLARMTAIIQECRPGFYLFNETTGSGKSYSIREAIKALHGAGWPARPDGSPVRLLILVKTKALVAEYLAHIPFAFHQMGRDDADPGGVAYCHNKPRIGWFADRGYNPVTAFCQATCIPEQKKANPNWTCAFLSHIASAEKQTVVIACYEAFLNFGDRIDDFDIIVIDEEIASQLAKIYQLRSTHLDAWTSAMNAIDRPRSTAQKKYPHDHPAKLVIEALQEEIMPQDGVMAANSVVTNLRTRFGDDWDRILVYLQLVAVSPELVDFEFLREQNTPLKLFAALANAIVQDNGALNSWGNTLYLGVAKSALINALRNKVVVNLDATPCVPLLEEIFGVDKVQPTHQVMPRLNISVCQFYSTNFNKDSFFQGDHRQLKKAVELANQCLDGRYTGGATYQRPLIVTYKDIVSRQLELASILSFRGTTELIYYGNQTRGSNSYDKSDVVIFMGGYTENISAAKSRVGCLRSSSHSPMLSINKYRDQMEGKYGSHWAYKAYIALENQPGELTLARCADALAQCEQDPLVRTYIDWARSAEVIQAIGRTRPNHPGKPTVHVYILTGIPFDDLQIDRLVSTEEALGPRQRPDNASRNQRGCKRSWVEAAEEDGCCDYKSVSRYCHEHFGAGLDRKTYKKHSRFHHLGEEDAS